MRQKKDSIIAPIRLLPGSKAAINRRQKEKRAVRLRTESSVCGVLA